MGMLCLPLYDGITGLSIGIDSVASISLPVVDLPVREKPVVCYGTSILQGGCASRPGMAHTNILSRWLNREFINLGFSGNALLDYEIAEKEVNSKNKTINEIFQTLKVRGEKNIYILSSKDMLGHDGEATVDGVHFTDLGFMRYSELLYPEKYINTKFLPIISKRLVEQELSAIYISGL